MSWCATTYILSVNHLIKMACIVMWIKAVHLKIYACIFEYPEKHYFRPRRMKNRAQRKIFTQSKSEAKARQTTHCLHRMCFFKLWRTQPVLLLFYCCIEMLATSKAFSVDSASSSTPRSTAAGTSHTINSAWSVLTISCKKYKFQHSLNSKFPWIC